MEVPLFFACARQSAFNRAAAYDGPDQGYLLWSGILLFHRYNLCRP